MSDEASTFLYEASDSVEYTIETSFCNEVMGCATVNGKPVVEGCKSFDEAMSRAIHHIERLD